MKKFLSLVLALVMTMSLVTVSAGAKDFTDNSKINYKEAVDVLSAVKVIDGYTDGAFNPSNTLTRGAAAKIICNLILGPTTASALVADAAPYKDVPANHTFAGYIAYCQKEGIISGYADGTFRPAATLTGYAFMKMLLGALGYDATIEAYTGANWSINVAKRALNIGLDDDLIGDFNGVKAVTREEACLYAFNTMKATMVDYDSTTNITIGGTQVVVGGSKAKEMEQGVYKDNLKKDGLQFAEKYFTDLKLDTKANKDNFGRPATTWYDGKDKIGTYAKTPDATYTAKVKSETIYKDLDLSDPYAYSVVTDGKPSTSFDVRKNGSGKFNAYDDKVGSGNGNLIEVYKDEERIVVINYYLMQVDGEYDTKDEELSLSVVDGVVDPELKKGEDKLSADDFSNLASFKDEDYVVVTVADGVVKSIAPAEKVTATVTEYVKDDTVTAGGKEYSFSAKADASKTLKYDLKSDYDLYLDPNGNVLFADGVEADGTYVYISEFATSGGLTTKGNVLAYAYFIDGTDDEITVSKVAGSKVDASDVAALKSETGWYTYSKKDNGKYELKTVSNKVAGSASAKAVITDYSANGTEINGLTKTLRGNSSTKFLVVNKDGGVSVYTGIKNVPDITLGTAKFTVAAISDGGSYAKYVFVDVGTDGHVKGGSKNSDLVFLMTLDKTGTDADDDTYYRYKAIVNGTETKIKLDTDTKAVPGYMYTDVEYTDKGYVTGWTEVSTESKDYDTNDFTVVAGGAVTYKNNTVIIGSTSFYMADDAKIFVIKDKDDVTTVSGSKLAKDYKAGFSGTAYGVISSDDDISALYIYVK